MFSCHLLKNCVFPYVILLVLTVISGFAAQAFAAQAATSTQVHKVTYQQNAAGATLTVTTNTPLRAQRIFVLRQPLRLVIDVNHVANPTVKLPIPPRGSLVNTMRFGHFSPSTTRFVLELSKELGRYETRTLPTRDGKQHQLVVTLVPNKVGAAIRETLVSSTTPSVPAPSKAPTASPRPSSLNTRLPMVVIDAGHGGKDPGAVASDSVYEKHLTLAYALALEKALHATGRYRVHLTRRDDTFVLLPERVRLAREAGGDIMISLHADTAGEASARGLSVYTVSEEASDAEAAALAKQENAVDAIGTIAFADAHPEVADILIDLASRDTRIKATDLALLVTEYAKKGSIPLLKNPNRYAGFRVLKSPDVPSVLVELGFLSNPQDEALLQTAAHRNKVVSAVVRSVDAYFVKHPKE
jgi:N-acetylmuramoyl-L-alanine amidase